MSKIKAQTVEEIKKKRIIIICFVLFVLLMSLMIILRVVSLNFNKQNLSYNQLETVEDVLNYYKCTYISEKQSEIAGYDVDIKLKFRYNLYENDVSNEKFFNNVINDVAKVLKYANFRMLDKEKDITIEVICENSKVSTIIINGRENYFIYMDSQIALKNYVELETTEFQLETPVIQYLIDTNWSSNVSFGTRESIVDSYQEYFDEGIKVRNIDGKIYNIIFTKKYNGNVVNGIFPGVEIDTVEAKMGEPTFKDEELGVIGYKGKNFYVFFTNKEISVYRVADIEIEDFFKLVDKLLSEELELLEFMNELTYLWPDYSDYEYDSTSVFLSYPLKGIDVKIGYEETNAIVVYNNVKANQTQVKKYLEHPEFVSNLQIDNVFQAEKRRVEKEKNLIEKCEEYIETLEDEEKEKIGQSNKFVIYGKKDVNGQILKMYFISKDGNYPNRQIYETVSSYLWINDDIFIYSQEQIGLYAYNVTTGTKTVIEKGTKKYNLESFENGILKFDNSELIIQ